MFWASCAVYALSTVDLPALAVPSCSYCLLLLSELHESRILAGLSKWRQKQRAAAQECARVSRPRYAASDFVFGISWIAEPVGEVAPPPDWIPGPLEPLKLKPDALAVLGAGPPSARLPLGWRRVTSRPDVKSKSTLLLKLHPQRRMTQIESVCANTHPQSPLTHPYTHGDTKRLTSRR